MSEAKLLNNQTLKELNYFNYVALEEAHNQLIDILSAELNELKKHNVVFNVQWQERKNDLSSFIGTQTKILAAHPEIKDKIPIEAQQILKELAQKLLDVGEEYRKRLMQATYVNDTLLDIVAKITKQQANITENYNQNGTLEVHPKKLCTLAVTINEAI